MSRLTRDEFEFRMKKVKMLLLDVDGILTDTKVYYINGQGWTRNYCVYDGYGIRLLHKNKMQIGVISGSNADDVKERCKVLNIEHFVLGSEDKLSSMEQIAQKTSIPVEEMCFMGDELFDIPALRKAGVSVTVPDAMIEVKEMANWVTTQRGGHGAVREVIDVIRKVQNWPIPY